MKFHVTPPCSSRCQRLCPVYKPVRGCWQFKRNVPDDRRQNVSILFRRQTLHFAGFSVGRGTTIQAEQGGWGPRWCDAGPDMEAVRHCHPQLGHAYGWPSHDTQPLPPMSPQHESPNVNTAAEQAAPGWRPIPKTGQLWNPSRHRQSASRPQPRPPHSPCQSVPEHPIQEDGTCRGHVPTACLSEHSVSMPSAFGNQGLIINTADKQFNSVRMSTAHCLPWLSRQSQFISIGGIS